ncbi:MAG: protein-L-isoaspartate(D-aspartate) O-methyltransferase [Aestuariivirgaceae bacterium]
MSADHRRVQLIMALRKQGIRDLRVLDAIERIPRDLFVEQPFLEEAWSDQSLPIACGQTISQPFVVAFMTQALRLGERMKVLEIGTGSGYQTAILSCLARRVYSVERFRSLLRGAEERFRKLHLHNITTMAADGTRGWPKQAPFERIIVTAAAKEVPRPLVDQLADGGIMVIPVEVHPGSQEVQRIVRSADRLEIERLLPVRFVPLLEGMPPEA